MSKTETTLSIGEILDAGIELFRRSFKTCFPLSLLISFITSGIPIAAEEYLPRLIENHFILQLPNMIHFKVGLMVLTIFSYTFLGKCLYSFIEYNPLLRTQALLFALRKIIPVFFLFFFMLLFCGIGFLLLLIPGIYLSISLMFSWGLVIGNNEEIFKALSMSHKIVKGKWWKVATLFLVQAILTIVLTMTLLLPATFALPFLHLETFSLIPPVLYLLVLLLNSTLVQLSLSLYLMATQILKNEGNFYLN